MKTIRFVAAYARNYIKPLVIAILAMIGLVGVQLLAPGIIRNLINLVQELDWEDPSASSSVTRLTLILLGIFIARIGFRFLANYMSHTAGWGVVADARRDIYHHLQRLSLSFYEEQQTGQLMSRMINDSEMFERLISHAIPDTLVSFLTLVGVSAVLLSMNGTLMLLTLIPVPLILIAMQGFNKYVRPAFRERQQELAELNATINDNLSGIREIKAFTREEIEAVRVSRRIDSYKDSMLKVLRYLAVFGPSVEFASSLGTVIVIYFGGRLAFQRVLPLADLVAFFSISRSFTSRCVRSRRSGNRCRRLWPGRSGCQNCWTRIPTWPTGPGARVAPPDPGAYQYRSCQLCLQARGARAGECLAGDSRQQCFGPGGPHGCRQDDAGRAHPAFL